jgi:hypothetical protein
MEASFFLSDIGSLWEGETALRRGTFSIEFF